MSRLICFDLESSGTDVENDRIVQAFVGLMDEDGNWIEKWEWLIDSGVEIPEGAAAVHGYTTERIREVGRKDVADAIYEIVEMITRLTADRPLVIYNASFDVSMLECEARRYGVFWDRADLTVIDPLVLDRAKEKYRKGSRKLVDVAPIYGVPVEENAHDAGADCLMTGRIALKMLESWKAPLSKLMPYQEAAAREQRTSLQEYFARSGKTEEDGSPIVIRQGWPIYEGLE